MTEFKYNIVCTHTDLEKPSFDIQTYPNWECNYIDEDGFILKPFQFYDGNGKKIEHTKLKKMVFNSDCNMAHDILQNDNANAECEPLDIYSDNYDKTWVIEWLKKNPGKHDHILKCIFKYDKDYYECEWTYNNKKYVLTEFSGTTYLVRCDDEIVCSICAPNCDLQDGDSRTDVFLLNEKHLIICNHGDVVSTIVFKFLL